MKTTSKVKNSDEGILVEETTITDILLSEATIEDILSLESMENYLVENYKRIEKPTQESNTTNSSNSIQGDDRMADEEKKEEIKPDVKPVVDGKSEQDVTHNTNTESTTVVDAKSEVKPEETDNSKIGDKGEVKTEENKPAGDDIVNDEIKNLTIHNAELHKQVKSGVVNRIIDHKLFLRKITSEEIEPLRKELEERTMDSLNDTLNDLLKENNDAFAPTEKAQSTQVNGGIKDKESTDWMDKMPTKGVDGLKDILPWL